MATYYWVGGAGTWNSTNTANWATSSGGTGGAGFPTSVDDVIFDANSAAGANYTVTLATQVNCRSFTATGVASGLYNLTLSQTVNNWNIYGSLTLPSTRVTMPNSNSISFLSTSAGNTITTNGVSCRTFTLNGAGGEWTLGSALTLTNPLIVTSGSFSTANFNVTTTALQSTGTQTRSISLGSSTVTLTGGGNGLECRTNTNLSFSAGTSNIVFSGADQQIYAGSQYGTGLTFNNVSITSVSNGFTYIWGNNTFNSLSISRRTSGGTHKILISGDQTFTAGTNSFTIGAAASANIRILLASALPDRAVTLTMASRGTMADIDFQNITIAGAAGTLTGTRIGDAGGNTNITATAAKTVFWSLAAGGTMTTSTCWATTSGGTPALNNFPLPQDTATINNTNLNTGSTIITGANCVMGALTASGRTNAWTLTLSTTANNFFFGSVNLGTNVTVSNNGVFLLSKIGGTVTFTGPATIIAAVCFRGTATANISNTTTLGGVGLAAGTLDISASNLTLTDRISMFEASTTSLYILNEGDNTFYSSKSIIFGTSKFIITSANGISRIEYAGFSCTGTPQVDYNLATAATFTHQGIASDDLPPTNEDFAFNVTAISASASSTFAFGSSPSYIKNFTSTSFSGAVISGTPYFYGNVTLSATGSNTGVSSGLNFRTVSALNTQTLTFNGRIIGVLTVNNTGTGSTVLGSSLSATAQSQQANSITMVSGTFDMNGFTATAGRLTIQTSAAKSINIGSQTITLVNSLNTQYAVKSASETNPGLNLTFTGLSTGTIQTRGSAIFEGGGNSFPTWDFYNVATLNPNVQVLGSSTFYDIKNAASTLVTTYTYTFEAGETNTFTNWTLNGTASLPVSIRSTAPGTQATISKSSGTVTVANFNIQDSQATGGAVWNATATSNTNSGNNTGWSFRYTGQANFFMFM